MPIIKLVDGKTANIPDKGFVVVNGEEAKRAQSICIVAMRNAPDDIPVFAYCIVGKKVAELNDKDFKEIDAAIEEKYPRYREIVKSSIRTECKCRNQDQFRESWMEEIEPGYFDLAAFEEYWLDSKSES